MIKLNASSTDSLASTSQLTPEQIAEWQEAQRVAQEQQQQQQIQFSSNNGIQGSPASIDSGLNLVG